MLYVLSMFGVSDVVGRADDGVAIITPFCIETRFFRSTDSWSGAFVDILIPRNLDLLPFFFFRLCLDYRRNTLASAVVRS